MNKQSLKLVLFFIIGLLSAFLVMYFIDSYRNKKEAAAVENSGISAGGTTDFQHSDDAAAPVGNPENIDELTREHKVINYLKATKQLPDYYVTKSEARQHGWVPAKGNLCEVLPGKAIGGDRFSNREKKLPADAQYFEADVNYSCGNRNADRIVFTKNGEVWLTHDHYKSFTKQ